MSALLGEGLVWLAVLAAAIFWVRRLRRQWRAARAPAAPGRACASCDACGGCPAPRDAR